MPVDLLQGLLLGRGKQEMPTDIDIDKAAWNVVELLDRWEQRMEEYSQHRRKHERRSFRQRIAIYPADDDSGAGIPVGVRTTTGWSRNLTPAGIGFVVPHRIAEDDVVVCMTSYAGVRLCVRATIRNRRKVHEEFWEHGVEFQERVEFDRVFDSAER